MAIKEIRFNNNEYSQLWLNGVKIWEKLSGGGGDSEIDSDGYVIVKYPALQKPKPTTWCALGDSITEGAGAGGSSCSYANVCANQQGISVINNYGVAGTCISAGFNTVLTELGVETAFCNRFGEMSDDADLITVLGSVNDHGTDVKIGSPTSTDKNDLYGALYVLINGLKQKYPNGRIVFITPFKINGWDGTNMYKHTLKDFRNAIVTQCNRFQIEVVDLFLQSQFDWSTGLDKGWFVSYDYYHPTAAGQQAIATYIGSVMFEEDSGGSGGSGEVTPNTFDFSQENAVEYGSHGYYRTPPISRAGYSKVTITTEVAGYIGIIMFSNETTIMASFDENYREIGTFSITIPTDICTYVAVEFTPSMFGHISAQLEI